MEGSGNAVLRLDQEPASDTLDFNNTAAPYPSTRLFHELFEEQVELRPDTEAVVYEGESLTYADLNAWANRLARILRAHGAAPEQLVAVCAERSTEMVVALLAVLKSGAAYVPLDPNYPEDRLARMLEASAPRVLLVQRRLRHRLPPVTAAVVELDGDMEAIRRENPANLNAADIDLHPDNLAYAIYTSGSTGVPKGVMVAHRNMLYFWSALEQRVFRNHPNSQRISWNAAFSFDASVQILVQLLAGRTLCILPEAVRADAQATLEFITRNRLQAFDCTPSQLPPLLAVGLMKADQYPKVVLVGGEEIGRELWSALQKSSTLVFYNVYGPTECTVECTIATINDSPDGRSRRGPNIGGPIENARIHILDAQYRQVPVGMEGEIYVAGEGVSRGYLRRPDLTAEQFLADPFSMDPGGRMYRTGDLGRWQPDGTVDYLGRNDQQVKIRGFRIELGEIESQLMHHPQVAEAVAIVREDTKGDKRLVAYFTSGSPLPIRAFDLRSHLQKVLPDYMIPGAYVRLERLPLTPNGKLNRQALPPPGPGSHAVREYSEPQGARERVLAEIWARVLGVQRVGRDDNFFELGGNSLLIVKMLEQLRQEGLFTQLQSVYRQPTVSGLADLLTERASKLLEVPPNRIQVGYPEITPEMLPLVDLGPGQIQQIVNTVPGGAANIKDIYPLAPLQEGILFHHLLTRNGGDTYILPTLFSLSSRDKLNELIEALQKVTERHDVMRTAVLWEQLPRPVQVVYRQVSLPVEECALERGRDPVEQLDELMRPERHRLDLRRAPSMKLQIAADPDGVQWYAVLLIHHLAHDHESIDTLLAELAAFLKGDPAGLPEPVPYRNHVAQSLAAAQQRDSEAFFRRKFGDVDEPTAPFGLVDVRGDGSRIEEARQVLDSNLARRIRAQARNRNVSPATVFHAAWALFIATVSGRDDVVFGTMLLGRLQGSAGSQRILGMFINMLPLRLRMQGTTARELIEQTQQELVDLLEHEQASLAVAQRCSGIAGGAPLFSSLLNYLHSAPGAQNELAPGVEIIKSKEWTNYPLALSVEDHGEGFVLIPQSDRSIDPHRVLSYMTTALQSLITALEDTPDIPALALSILPSEERHRVVVEFNSARASYPRDRLIHELFEEQARALPDQVALCFEGDSLTYAQLNARSNQLARFLRAAGVGPDRIVGICVERGLQMVVGLLGILKAGGAYLPLDPSYPRERLAYMLNAAGPAVVVTQKHLHDCLPPSPARRVDLDDHWPEIAVYSPSSRDHAALGLKPNHLAYVIFTSGSTGLPKGVMGEHAGLCNLARVQRSRLQVQPDSKVLQFASLSFDACLWECVMALCSGATLVLASKEDLLPGEALERTIQANQITHVTLPPIALSNLDPAHDLPVQTLIVAGEACPVALVEQWRPGRAFVNAYGPTEATVCATMYPCDTDVGTSVPIGSPIPNAQIYILDERCQPTPIGVIGEIYIGGAGLARGYLGQPQLTAERFLCDLFSADPRARMYRTGDLGRWRSDGVIEYLGRNDHQVKIRGFRIELGEIEAQLLRHAQVKEAIVLAREDVPGQKRLVAYVTGFEHVSVNVEELRNHLAAVLPEYMVPSAYVKLDRLPATPNGKLDRQALPAPELGAFAARQYEAPLGETEAVVAAIWRDLLQVERVGRHDNFFELGGHSLLAMQLMVRIRAATSIELSVGAVFSLPTLKELAADVDAARAANLAATLEEGDEDLDELIAMVAAMPEDQAEVMVGKLRAEGRL